MTLSEARPLAFARQLLAAQSVADLTFGPGRVVYIHLQSKERVS
jgi:hypothetical protein